MKGTHHMLVGTGVALGVGTGLGVEPVTLGILGVIGGVSGLVPDLDLNGKLSNRITLSNKMIKTPLFLLGLIIIFLNVIDGFDNINYLGLLSGIGLIGLSYIFKKQKRMLTLTGIGIVLLGFSTSMIWVILAGVYVIISSFASHRGITHSIWGILFFGIIVWFANEVYEIEGLFLVGVLAYISHIICDFKILPFNKRGIKIFYPVLNKEI